jgi:hypothetical protein
MIHKTRIPMYPSANGTDTLEQRMRQQITEAMVSLYRRSQAAGEEGQAYALYMPCPETAELEIGFVRGNELDLPATMLLFGINMRKLSDADIMRLFEQA